MISQLIQDGKIVGQTTAAGESLTGAKVKSSMNETKEMFLQLLVAEMQYQDPLEPTDNSEYVKELASFTQVETMNNVQDDISKLTAQALAGKYVSLTDEDTGGIVEGKVEFVTENAGEQYVSIEGKLYKAEAVTSVHDADYFESVTMADSFSSLVNQMPNENALTVADEDKWGILNTIYSGMTETQKKYISQETLDKFAGINQRMSELLTQREMANTSGTETAVTAAAGYDNEDAGSEDTGTSEGASNESGGTSADGGNASGSAGQNTDDSIGTTTAQRT